MKELQSWTDFESNVISIFARSMASETMILGTILRCILNILKWIHFSTYIYIPRNPRDNLCSTLATSHYSLLRVFCFIILKIIIVANDIRSNDTISRGTNSVFIQDELTDSVAFELPSIGVDEFFAGTIVGSVAFS